MSAESINMSEWLAELSRLQERQVDGYSSEELAEAWGCSTKTALGRLKTLIRSGRAINAGWRNSQSVAGRSARTPVYRLVP